MKITVVYGWHSSDDGIQELLKPHLAVLLHIEALSGLIHPYRPHLLLEPLDFLLQQV